MNNKLPTFFISHGGGPWPYVPQMRAAMHVLEASLVQMVAQLPRPPTAVLMVSGHWEEADAYAVMASPNPGMLYDYSGFPPHTYQVVYPAPGNPELAQRVGDLLAAAGLPTRQDAQRGFDHGSFAPLAVMFPKASVPVVQLSLRSHMQVAEHIAVGAALAPLREEGVLVVGSGLSYHNLRMMGPPAALPSTAFDAWLQTTLALTGEARNTALAHWAQAPHARVCHPHEDHLIPLMVAAGAAPDSAGVCCYHEDAFMGGAAVSSFRFD